MNASTEAIQRSAEAVRRGDEQLVVACQELIGTLTSSNAAGTSNLSRDVLKKLNHFQRVIEHAISLRETYHERVDDAREREEERQDRLEARRRGEAVDDSGEPWPSPDDDAYTGTEDFGPR